MPMRNEFAYSYRMKIHELRLEGLLESVFSILLVIELFSLQKDFLVLENVVIGCKFHLTMVEEAKGLIPIHSTFEVLILLYLVKLCSCFFFQPVRGSSLVTIYRQLFVVCHSLIKKWFVSLTKKGQESKAIFLKNVVGP